MPSSLLKRIFPDRVIGFDITDAIVDELKSRGAFADPHAAFPQDIAEKYQDQPGQSFADVHPFLQGNEQLSLWLNRFTTILGTISGKKPRRAWSHKHTPALESDKSSQSQDAIAYDLETRGGERAPDSHMFHWADVQVLIELSTDKRTSTAIKNFRDKGVAMKFYQAIRPFLSLSKFFRDKFVFVVYDHAGCQREELSYDNVKALTRLIAGFSFASDEAIGFDTTMTRKAGQATRIRVNKHILRVIYYIHTSASLNGRCTWIYLVQDEEGTYSVVKDSWVDVSKQHDEAMFLRRCKDLPHVVYLHDSWDVTTSDGVVDSTDRRRDPYEEGEDDEEEAEDDQSANSREQKMMKRVSRVHRRLWIGPVCMPIVFFESLPELVGAFADIMRAHKALAEIGILHRDMSINNLALDDVQELVKRLTEDDTSSSTTHDDDIKEELPTGQAPVQKGEPSKPEPPATRRVIRSAQHRAAPRRVTTADAPSQIKTSTVGAKPTALPNTSGPTPTPKHVPRSRPNPRGLHSGSVRRYGCRRGVLLDLDFATFFKRYWTLAGARFNDTVIGTPPFVSAELLDLRVTHKIQHDIESLLCVMIYMACVIEGPGLDRSDGAENLKVLRWKNGDATEMADAKRADMFPNLEKLTKEFTPYFQPLIPICNKIYNALFPEGSDAKRCKRVSFSEVTHDQIIEILDKAFYKMIREQEVTCKQPRRMTHESQNAKAAPGLKSAWRY